MTSAPVSNGALFLFLLGYLLTIVGTFILFGLGVCVLVLGISLALLGVITQMGLDRKHQETGKVKTLEGEAT